MELALAIVTLLGSITGLALWLFKRSDKKKEERNRRADEADKMFQDGMENNDDLAVRRALDRLKRLRKP